MARSSSIAEYNKLVAEQTRELEAWINSDPTAKRRLIEHIGSDRSLRTYLMEYSNKYAIVAYLADDLGYPGADKMLAAYNRFSRALEEKFD